MNTVQVVFGDHLYVYACYVYKLILRMCYLVLYLFGNKLRKKLSKRNYNYIYIYIYIYIYK